MRGRIGTLAAGIATAALLVGPALSADAAPSTGLPAGAGYVALGDSYSAGYGIAPTTGEPVVGCDQSAADYPHQVGTALGLSLTDVTCSGAETTNIDQTEQTMFPGGAATPAAALQDTALNSDTRVVTLTIGGNDLGFSTIAQQCVAETATGPVLGGNGAPNCKSFLDTGSTTANPEVLLRTVVAPAIARVLTDIRAKAPNAQVFVLEYPAIAPTAQNTPAGGCFRPMQDSQGNPVPDAFPFTDVDVPYLHQLQADLNAVVDAAAAAAGAHTVPTFAASDAHSACATGTAQWVNGITLSSSGVQPGALHPNATGVADLTTAALTAITATIPPAPTPSPTPSTTPSGSTTSSAPVLAATGVAAPVAGLAVAGVALLAAGGALTFVRRPRRRA